MELFVLQIELSMSGSSGIVLSAFVFVSWFPPIQCLRYRGGGVFYGVCWLAAFCFTVVFSCGLQCVSFQTVCF